jgi:hypothetical protein
VLSLFQGDQCYLDDFPDFEVSCVADGDLMDVNLSRFNEVAAGIAGGNFEGRQLPKRKMRRMLFARPVRLLPLFPVVRILIPFSLF